jgi:tetratricopeptide (TPR) repeat protein
MAYGMIYREMKDFENAEKYFKKAFTYFKKISALSEMVLTYMEYSLLYIKQEKYGVAYKILKNAERIAKKIKAENVLEKIRGEMEKCKSMGGAG